MKRIAIITPFILAATLSAHGVMPRTPRYVAVVFLNGAHGQLGAFNVWGSWQGAGAKERCEAWAAQEPARDKRVVEGGAVCMPVLSVHGGGK
jgi:hypothetical protein